VEGRGDVRRRSPLIATASARCLVDGLFRRSGARRAAVVAMIAAGSALAVALLVPNLYSDPNGLDPNDFRLAAVGLLLCAVAHATRRLQASRAVLLAVLAITVSYSALSALPQFLVDRGVRISGPALLFWASLAQFLITLAAMAACLRLPRELGPMYRLRHFGRAAALFTLGGVLLVTLGWLLLPAQWFGREGLPWVALVRDMPWLIPANILQAAAQELQFRGMLQGSLERVLPRLAANIGQALFFGFAHLAVLYQGPLLSFVPLTIGVGLLFGWVAQRTESLWPVLIAHAVADIVITATVLYGLYGL